MLDHGQLHFAALHQAAVLAELIERLSRQIAALQQDQGQVFGERGIGCGPHQCFG
jgi:hypothetical protein